jgi:hypothetical protein
MFTEITTASGPIQSRLTGHRRETMGERSYTVIGRDGEYEICFSSEDNDFGCLCTFPSNDGGTLDRDRLRELALLGAAVVLACYDDALLDPVAVIGAGEFFVGLPYALPAWIPAEILRLLPDEDAAE